MEMKWIDRKEQLPPVETRVLVEAKWPTGDKEVWISFTTKRFPDMFDDLNNDIITHWMPLPEPTKGKAHPLLGHDMASITRISRPVQTLEAEIRRLVVEVENSGASIDLTKCSIALQQAQRHLADHLRTA